MLTHSFEVRDAEVKGRTVVLACVPYDVKAPVADANGDPYFERFERGAFRNVVKAPHVVQLLHDHRPGVGFGYARSLREAEPPPVRPTRVGVGWDPIRDMTQEATTPDGEPLDNQTALCGRNF